MSEIVVAQNTSIVPGQSTKPNPALTYLAGLAESSRVVQRDALRTIARIMNRGPGEAETFPWWSLRYEHTVAIRASLVKRFSASTVNRHLAALRGVLRECWKMEMLDRDTMERTANVKGAHAAPTRIGRMLSEAEVTALFVTANDEPSPKRERDRALITIAFAGGLRRSEIAGLDFGDWKDGALTVRHGKGDKLRVAPLPADAEDVLTEWIDIRGRHEGPLLVGISAKGELRKTRLFPGSITGIFDGLARGAGIEDFSPHDLRRTFVSTLLAKGVDLAMAQRLAGHANIATTSRYDRRGEEEKKKAVQILKLPGVKK